MQMFVELSQELILMSAGAFLVGWLLSSISSSLGAKYRAKKRDSRDDRIRSLEAELRISESNNQKALEEIAQREKENAEAYTEIEKRDSVISHQQKRVEAMERDLKESVMKTRELRAELSDRATENIKSEVKLREVETELSVAHASSQLLTTGVLDYSKDTDDDDGANDGLSEVATQVVD